MNAAQQKCRAARVVVNMQRSVAVLPYLKGLNWPVCAKRLGFQSRRQTHRQTKAEFV